MSDGGLLLRLQLDGPGRVELQDTTSTNADGTANPRDLLDAVVENLNFAVYYCTDEMEAKTGCIAVSVDLYHIKNPETGGIFCVHTARDLDLEDARRLRDFLILAVEMWGRT